MSTEPRRLGKYELQKRLAHGGMGEVWKALDTQLGRYVAIKLLRTDVQDNPEFAQRFEQEARFIAALRHPNIVQIHDFSISQPPESDIPTAYIVMDYIEGQTLADYIRSTSRKGNFPPATEIVAIFSATSRALDYAHSTGKIHRDIKPANILLDQRLPSAKALGEPTLIDFGIARLQGTATGTVAGSLLGTPLYISPEQAQGLHGDHRSDLYSLGIILYEMMTGITPFRGDTTIAILMQHIHDMPTHPSLINPQISPALAEIILKSIAKKPEDRFPTATAMTIALANALHVPVPKSLLPSTAHSSRSPSASSSPSSALGMTPPSVSNSHNPPVHLENARQFPVNNPHAPYADPVTPPDIFVGTPSASHQNLSGQPFPQMVPFPVEQAKTSKAPLKSIWSGKGRYLFLGLIALLVLAVTGAGFLAFSQSTQSTPAQKPTPQAPLVAGKLQFLRSAQAQNGSYDELQIDVRNVPPPPAGRVYYAWIDSANSETSRPHWQLAVTNGNIQTTLTYPKNLLSANTFFLITAEDKDMPPIVPYTALNQRFFYANITTTSSTSFDVKRCPTNPSSTPCSG